MLRPSRLIMVAMSSSGLCTAPLMPQDLNASKPYAWLETVQVPPELMTR